jgi:hypothetical protein
MAAAVKEKDDVDDEDDTPPGVAAQMQITAEATVIKKETADG